MDREMRFRAYFGEDESQYDGLSFVGALAGANVPLFVVLAEFDPPDFVNQFVVLLETHVRRQVPMPRVVQLMAHNHFTTTWCMNTGSDTLGPEIVKFVGV
jgi:hypothetical protein